MEEIRQKIDFLVHHPGFFITYISMNYPLPARLIEKYKSHWDWYCLTENTQLEWTEELAIRFKELWIWEDEDYFNAGDGFLVSTISPQSNECFPWTLRIIEEYKNKINWESLSQNTKLLQKYPQILEKYRDRLYWDYISGNEKIRWSAEMVEKFKDKWHWEYLSGNRSVPWNGKMRKRYHDKFDIDRFISGNDEPWLDINRQRVTSLPPSYNIPHTGTYTKEEFAIVLKHQTLKYLSGDERIPWTEGLIEFYKEEWDWQELSYNKALPWSEKLIDKYLYRWEWGHMEKLGKYRERLIPGLSHNPALPWSSSFIRKYDKRWSWEGLSFNEGLPWSLDLITEFYHKWVWISLQENETMWNTVFLAGMDEHFIDEVMEKITQES